MSLKPPERQKEGQQPKPTRYYSKKQESAVAAAVGGERTPNSGATPFIKGDVEISGAEGWLIECKTKTSPSKSMAIQKEWLEKNRQEAVFMGKKYCALAFNFGPDEENHFIIDEWLFKELVDYLREKETEAVQ